MTNDSPRFSAKDRTPTVRLRDDVISPPSMFTIINISDIDTQAKSVDI